MDILQPLHHTNKGNFQTGVDGVCAAKELLSLAWICSVRHAEGSVSCKNLPGVLFFRFRVLPQQFELAQQPGTGTAQ